MCLWGKWEKEVDRHVSFLEDAQKVVGHFFSEQMYLLTSLQIINSLFTKKLGFTICTIPVLWQ